MKNQSKQVIGVINFNWCIKWIFSWGPDFQIGYYIGRHMKLLMLIVQNGSYEYFTNTYYIDWNDGLMTYLIFVFWCIN